MHFARAIRKTSRVHFFTPIPPTRIPLGNHRKHCNSRLVQHRCPNSRQPGTLLGEKRTEKVAHLRRSTYYLSVPPVGNRGEWATPQRSPAGLFFSTPKSTLGSKSRSDLLPA